ncbi:MAG: flavodoxin family protein [Desertimonas sp.]
MAQLLIVQHTPSPATHTLLTEVRAGATDPAIDGVDVVVRAALEATVSDVLAADGYLLGAPANLGYLAGALKHFFDQIYYPCLESTIGRPFGAWLHGNDDTTGAARAIESITAGLRWRRVAPTLELTGAPDAAARAAGHELGAVVAATLMDEPDQDRGATIR